MASLSRTVSAKAKLLPKNAFSSLVEEFPWTPGSTAASFGVIETTTLPNGMKVISKETGSATSTVGVAVTAGSRFGSSTGGEALLLKHLAFKGTTSRSDIKMARDLEGAGLSAGAAAGREQVLYTVAGMSAGGALGSVGLEAVAEAVLSPKLVGWNVSEVCKESVAVELGSAAKDAQLLLVEKIHAAAFGEDAPLGAPYYAAADQGSIASYHSCLYTPSNMTLVGCGDLTHASLVDAAVALFPGDAAAAAPAPAPSSPYVGGSASLKAASPVTHVSLAFPGAAAGSPGYFSALVLAEALQAIAGPSCSAFSLSYADTGLVGLYGCAPPSAAGALCEDMAAALNASASLDDARLAAAKMAVKTQLLVAAEDSASLAPGLASVGAAADGSGVDAVTAAGVKAFAAAMLKAAPAMATVGPAAAVPSYGAVAKMF